MVANRRARNSEVHVTDEADLIAIAGDEKRSRYLSFLYRRIKLLVELS